MVATRPCQIVTRYRGVESRCGKESTHFVTYFTDGSGGNYCCPNHIARAIDVALDTPPAGLTEIVKVTRLRTRAEGRTR